eukprot:TRINITY_DN2674_c0_g2_i1.p2 TRINITY_DN2674_c0_g2~~TRINITY_DN2674_c0_g2_i1.p2  ORF type:complete len:195 (-),score=24.05 TRINITY_DN2674_c0_g2_i1:172-756(-)
MNATMTKKGKRSYVHLEDEELEDVVLDEVSSVRCVGHASSSSPSLSPSSPSRVKSLVNNVMYLPSRVVRRVRSLLGHPYETDHLDVDADLDLEGGEELSRWEVVTIILFCASYWANVLCRSTVDVSLPAMEADKSIHFDIDDAGTLLAIGTGIYFCGKLCSGVVVDRFGGKPIMLLLLESIRESELIRHAMLLD